VAANCVPVSQIIYALTHVVFAAMPVQAVDAQMQQCDWPLFGYCENLSSDISEDDEAGKKAFFFSVATQCIFRLY
jgi:heme A synthase